MAKQSQTRARILDIAENAVLTKGFGATSIDEIVAGVEITKGGFFYHFPDKNALAHALLIRYIETEDALFDDLERRAGELTDDPLQMFLVFLKMLAELFNDMENGHPGCLIATTVYQDRLFDREVRALNHSTLVNWRQRFRRYLDDIAAVYPLRDHVPLDDVADMVSAIVEGGIVLSKGTADPKATGRQIELFRSYIKLLFGQTNR